MKKEEIKERILIKYFELSILPFLVSSFIILNDKQIYPLEAVFFFSVPALLLIPFAIRIERREREEMEQEVSKIEKDKKCKCQGNCYE